LSAGFALNFSRRGLGGFAIGSRSHGRAGASEKDNRGGRRVAGKSTAGFRGAEALRSAEAFTGVMIFTRVTLPHTSLIEFNLMNTDDSVLAGVAGRTQDRSNRPTKHFHSEGSEECEGKKKGEEMEARRCCTP